VVISETPTEIRSKYSRDQGEALYQSGKISNEKRQITLNSSTVKGEERETAPNKVENNANEDTKAASTEESNSIDDNNGETTENLLIYPKDRNIENVSWQDFSSYLYALDPVIPQQTDTALLEQPEALKDFKDANKPEIIALKQDLYKHTFHRKIRKIKKRSVRGKYFNHHLNAIVSAGVLSVLYEYYYSFSNAQARVEFLRLINFPQVRILTESERLEGARFIQRIRAENTSHEFSNDDLAFILIASQQRNFMNSDYSEYLSSYLPLIEQELSTRWWMMMESIEDAYYEIRNAEEERKEDIIEQQEYNFETYEPESYNLGVRFVYRQEWRPLGIQRGEVVRTIPLGPKQTERVTSKIIRREKVEKAFETTTESESSSEKVDTTKDSSEIINETSKKFNWNVETQASVSVGVFKGSLSAGVGGERTKRNSETISHLTESMQKTASRTRKETKVSVNTESEMTSESESFSEIVNPNDEIALTYYYSTMQRQYEVMTRLAEIGNVVFIAEEMPDPDSRELGRWVEKYDWIISKVLLDESFREGLSLVCMENQGPQELNSTITDRIDSTMESVVANMGKLASSNTGGLNQIDIIREAQRAYRETWKDETEKTHIKNEIEKKKERFLRHVRRNILHYCRAVWSNEDADQRMHRYNKRNIMIPTRWHYVVNMISFAGSNTIGTPSEFTSILDEMHSLHEAATDFVMVRPQITLTLCPDMDSVRPITDVINPAGPIGYTSNYAIYYLRSDIEFNENGKSNMPMLTELREPYSDEEGNLIDPSAKVIEIGKEHNINFLTEEEKIKFVEAVPELQELYENCGNKDDFLNSLHERNDVDVKALYREYFCKNLDEDTILDLIEFIPEYRAEYNSRETLEAIRDFINNLKGAITEEQYREYRFRKEFSRRLVVDTNNVMVDIIPGEGSALEHFKREHRKVDVKRAIEETRSIELNNERRNKLIENKKLGDPDIEKVVLVGSNNGIGSLLTLDEKTEVD
jgi:hypothetical protein